MKIPVWEKSIPKRHSTLTAPTTAGATMPTRQTHGFRNPAMRAAHIEKRAGMPI